ncbi:hypothetical protein OESDEN_12109 [Oesophagostomum dentatum]|uniref:Uncharacterized protein n=1 Tax=Oesophagostomum dentatum TaxID=61180 RepID=A0A0B1SW31_OESDE|nr:hypothetical protein OESDEN_12109 [Oesophagostomum dentatum]
MPCCRGSFPPPASQNSPGRGRGSLPLESAETKTSLYTTSDSNNDAISEYLALRFFAVNTSKLQNFARPADLSSLDDARQFSLE